MTLMYSAEDIVGYVDHAGCEVYCKAHPPTYVPRCAYCAEPIQENDGKWHTLDGSDKCGLSDHTHADEDEPSPLYGSEMGDDDAVQVCNMEHLFCRSCGADMEPAGHPDADIRGPFAECPNCDMGSIYVDGHGYYAVQNVDDALGALDVVITRWDDRVFPTYLLDENRHGKVTEIIKLTFSVGRARVFVVWHDDDPTYGIKLILADDENEAWEHADDEATEAVGASECGHEDDVDGDDHEGCLSDARAAVKVYELDRTPRTLLNDAIIATVRRS